MPTIPTPFVGGSDSPRRDTDGKDKLAPPFVPETQRQHDAAPGGKRGSGAQQADVEAIIPVEVVDDDAAAEIAETGAEEVGAAAAQSGVEEAAAGADADLPDWLVGADLPTPEEQARSAEEVSSAGGEPDDLAAIAQALQQGKWGSRIHELVIELGPFAADVAIARAFAAGYLAAREREGN